MKKKRKLAPLLSIRQRKGSEKRIMTGGNTVLTIDGRPVKGAIAAKFEVNARGIAKATITVIGRFNIKGRPLTTKLVNKY